MQDSDEEGMEILFKEFPKIQAEDEFKAFHSFYSGKIDDVTIWLKTKFLTLKYAKNTKKSEKYRNTGNGFYSKNKFEEALKNFTSALNYAEFNSEAYSLALANRSAAYFYLKDYRSCIKDIESCLNSNYPLKFHPKVYIRKAEALEKLGCLTDDFLNITKKVILDSINMNKEEKENRIKKLNELSTGTTKIKDVFELKEEIKDIKDDFVENPNFAYASEAVQLCYDTKRGRYVKATRNISEGEILFQEDAFFFAPIFITKDSLIPNKCHHCLSDTIASIPCKTCTLMMYCNETCRDECWEEFHKWECAGMRAGIWYDLGISYPALRGVIKALKANFPKPENEYKTTTEKYGDKKDNYLYFNKLLTNFECLKSHTQILVLSSVVIIYLDRETEFFSYATKQLNSLTLEKIKMKCGGLLTRHILQLSGNSSVITHWNKTKDKIPTKSSQIACGIYPSVSMMNHSCKPNITMFYNKTTVIAKALNNIKKGEEIFNCYGVDYRYTPFETRRDILKTVYHFDCKCEVCSKLDLENDIIYLSYMCQNCKGSLCNISGVCYNCKKPAVLEYYKKLEVEANSYLEKENLIIDDLQKCYNIRSNIYVKNHDKICECLDMFVQMYKKEGNFLKMLEYFNKSLNMKKITIGSNARSLAIETINVISDIVDELKRNTNHLDKIDILNEIRKMHTDAYKILLLYYPKKDLILDDLEDFIRSNCVN